MHIRLCHDGETTCSACRRDEQKDPLDEREGIVISDGK
jgi:hypothetical protein